MFLFGIKSRLVSPPPPARRALRDAVLVSTGRWSDSDDAVVDGTGLCLPLGLNEGSSPVGSDLIPPTTFFLLGSATGVRDTPESSVLSLDLREFPSLPGLMGTYSSPELPVLKIRDLRGLGTGV